MPRLFPSDAVQTNPDQRQLIDVSKSKKLTLNILKNLKESVLDYKALKKASEKLIGNRQSATHVGTLLGCLTKAHLKQRTDNFARLQTCLTWQSVALQGEWGRGLSISRRRIKTSKSWQQLNPPSIPRLELTRGLSQELVRLTFRSRLSTPTTLM